MTEPTIEELKESYIQNAYAQSKVGEFLQNFALMESALDDVVGAALNLDLLQATIISANLNLMSKVHVATAAIDYVFVTDKEQKKFKGKVNRIPDRARERNLIAHHYFQPAAESDGIVIHAFQAKGILKFNQVHWSQEDLKAKNASINTITDSLKAVALAVTAAPKRGELVKTLMNPPNLGLYTTTSADQEQNPFLGLLGSIPPASIDQ